MRRQFLISFALAAITLAIYWPVRNYGLIEFDDPEFVQVKPEITQGITWHGILWAFSNPVAANWHPVTTLSHMLDCQLFGRNLGAHHLVSVAIHAANSALLFLLLTQTTGARWRSALVAAVFSWHPLRVESVVWIAERKDVLSGLFFLLTLVAYAKYVSSTRLNLISTDSTTPRSHARRFYVLALLLFTLGLMSKPMLVTLPFVLLLLDFWPLGRWKVSTVEPRGAENPLATSQPETCNLQPATLWPLLREKIPFFAVAVIACGFTLRLQRGAMSSLASISIHDRIANAIVSYARYLGKAFWPAKLSIIYPHPAAVHSFAVEWPDWQVALIALLLLAISAACVVQLRARPYLAAGWLWYLGTMVPVIGIIQVGEQAMADRYTYLPLIGPTFALVWLCADFFIRRAASAGNYRTALAAFIAASVLAASCVVTHRQIQYWRDTVTLFTHAKSVTANNSSAEFFIGLSHEKQGDPEKAIEHYKAAIELNPYDYLSHYDLAQLLRKAGQLQSAAEHYRVTLQIRPSDMNARLNLANILPQLGRTAEAIQLYNDVLQVDPDSLDALNNLAWLFATSSKDNIRDGSRAVQLAQRACELTKYKITPLVGTLAAAYAEAGQFTDAVATAEKACALATESKDAKLLQKNQELLALFRNGHPYRETLPEPTSGPEAPPQQRN
jgi:tetratricopeptide (TPR) repeat protein